MNAPACISPFDIVEGQLQAYNDQDLDAFCSFYADDAVLCTFNGEVQTRGLGAIRARHADLFARFPQNTATLKGRHVLGSHVIDHEHVERSPGGENFEVAAIYTISDGRIVRVDFVK